MFLSYALIVSALSTAQAATRTVSFSATSRTHASTNAATQTVSEASECMLTITNLSNVNQRIVSVQFTTLTGTDAATRSVLTTSGAGSSWQYGLVSSSADCVGATIAPNSVCVVRQTMSAVPAWTTARIALCAGRIQVSDAGVAGTSGSVIASGTVQLLQESQVLGGTLAGAYYASNNRTPTGYTAPNGQVLSYDAYNMNVFCAAACMTAFAGGGVTQTWTNTRCQNHCGTAYVADLGDANQSPTVRYWNWGAYAPKDIAPGTAGYGTGTMTKLFVSAIPSYINEFIGDRATLGYAANASGTPSYTLFPPNENSVGASTIMGIDMNTRLASSLYTEERARFSILGFGLYSVFRNGSGASPFVSNSTLAAPYPVSRRTTNVIGFTDTQNLAAGLSTEAEGGMIAPDINGTRNSVFGPHVQNHLVRTSDPIFTGGMVYELQLGAASSICNGNGDLYTGGRPASLQPGAHPHRNVSRDVSIEYLDPAMIQTPPEVLVCHHRHEMPDLFMKVGQSYPFAINGGQPF